MSSNTPSRPAPLGPVIPPRPGTVPVAMAGRVLGPILPGVRVGPAIPVYGDHR